MPPNDTGKIYLLYIRYYEVEILYGVFTDKTLLKSAYDEVMEKEQVYGAYLDHLIIKEFDENKLAGTFEDYFGMTGFYEDDREMQISDLM